jgi:hypothetical protein
MTTGQATAVDGIRTALAEVGDALACGALDRLLAAEPVLSAAVDNLAKAAGSPLDESGRAAVEEARGALLRCRRLGASLVEFTRISLDPQGGHAYSRAGRMPAFELAPNGTARAAGSMLEARG